MQKHWSPKITFNTVFSSTFIWFSGSYMLTAFRDLISVIYSYQCWFVICKKFYFENSLCFAIWLFSILWLKNNLFLTEPKILCLLRMHHINLFSCCIEINLWLWVRTFPCVCGHDLLNVLSWSSHYSSVPGPFKGKGIWTLQQVAWRFCAMD